MLLSYHILINLCERMGEKFITDYVDGGHKGGGAELGTKPGFRGSSSEIMFKIFFVKVQQNVLYFNNFKEYQLYFLYLEDQDHLCML